MALNDNLFYTVMEADGEEMEAFDANAEAPADAGGTDDMAPPATEDSSGGDADADTPPDMNTDDFGDMGGLNDMGGDTSEGGDESTGEGGGNEEEADKQDTKLSDKANNILNQTLYTKFVNRNKEIEGIINSVIMLQPRNLFFKTGICGSRPQIHPGHFRYALRDGK